MRAPFMMLPLALALCAPTAILAQEGARVLFCAGECFVVDGKGVRMPAPKGTEVPPGFRVVTGPGGYVQVKLSASAAIGLGENANVLLQRANIVLDEGRIRLVGGEAFGKPITQPIELRTTDGTFTLRNADVEMKTGRALPTLVKLNAGDALFGSTELTKDRVQRIETGKIVEGPVVALTEVALPTKVATFERSSSGPLTLSFAPTTFTTRLDTFRTSETFSRLDKLSTVENQLVDRSKLLTSPEKFLAAPATDDAGNVTTVATALKEVTTFNRLQSVNTQTTISADKTQTTVDLGGTKTYTYPTKSTTCFTRGC